MNAELRVEVFDHEDMALAARVGPGIVLESDDFYERPMEVLCSVGAGDFPSLMDEVMGNVSDQASHFLDLANVIDLRLGLDSTDLESDEYDEVSEALEQAEEILRDNPQSLIAITLE